MSLRGRVNHGYRPRARSMAGTQNAEPFTVLLDGMIRPWAVTHESVIRPQTVQWGPLTLTLPVAGLGPKPRLETNHVRRQRQMDCLPRIVDLAASGEIRLFTTFEIDFEGWGRPGVIGKGTDVDLFRSVKVEKIPPAVNRTVLWGGIESETKGKKQRFLDGIRDKRFLDLRAVIGSKHAGDIFHLWSAEKAGVDAFLTMDLKFINAVMNARRNRRGIAIEVDVLSPSELCEGLSA